MIRKPPTRSTIACIAVSLISGLLALPSVAKPVEFSKKQFNVVDTAKNELCLLNVRDFNFDRPIWLRSGDPFFELNANSRASVQLFSESQAATFWENSNSLYHKHYRKAHPIKQVGVYSASAKKKMQSLTGVIETQLCSAEHMARSLTNAANVMRDSGVLGADRSSCFVTRQSHPH